MAFELELEDSEITAGGTKLPVGPIDFQYLGRESIMIITGIMMMPRDKRSLLSLKNLKGTPSPSRGAHERAPSQAP